MFEKKLALHETMELHEVINFMTTSLLKSKLSQGVVFDDDLRALLDKNVKLSTPALTAMVKLYSKSELEY
ncbi:spore coat protein [Lysinibacillus fusiformis]|uniref:spore coat protein n=1 Tax=Lysinibacillus fusiformis TaxID=28031 RepID=UPI0018828B75|nr:spore coat protein [Lysinibacillus fusiformis]MBD8521040.1 spore coat protein [Lysinibacillus fusiformis]